MRKKSSSFNFNAQSGWLLFGGIWLVVGAPFLIIGLYTAVQEMSRPERFEKEGRVAQGMVLEKSISSTGRSSSTPQYWLTYRFAGPEGQVVQDRAQVSVEVWNRLEERGPIQVTYLPGEAKFYRVEGQSSGWVLPVIFSILGGVLTVLGGCILLMALGRMRRARRLQF